MTDIDEIRNDLKTGLPYLTELLFRVAAATTDSPNAEVPGGQALYMTGPTADPEAFANRELSVIMGRLEEGAIEPARPGDPPAVGYWLADWETDLRVARDDEPAWALNGRAGFSVKYLLERVDWMLTLVDGELQYPPVLERNREMQHLIRRLEDCIHDGIRDDTGAPCPECSRPLVKHWAPAACEDRWQCKHGSCDVDLTIPEYVRIVRRDYLANATTLTAPDIEEQYDVRPGTLWVWANRGEVRKCGVDQAGAKLYSVEDVARKISGGLTMSQDAVS